MKKFLMTVAVVGAAAVAAPAAKANGPSAGGTSASASAAAGASAQSGNATVNGFGVASIGGAQGVDTTIIGMIGVSRPNKCAQVMNSIAFVAQFGQVYSRASVNRAVEEACPIGSVQSAGATRVSTSGGVSTPRLVRPAPATSDAMPVALFVRPAVAGGSVFQIDGQNRTIDIDPATVPVGGTMRIGSTVYVIGS